MQTFNQLFFKKKQIFSYFFKEISDKVVRNFNISKIDGKRTVGVDHLEMNLKNP